MFYLGIHGAEILKKKTEIMKSYPEKLWYVGVLQQCFTFF